MALIPIFDDVVNVPIQTSLKDLAKQHGAKIVASHLIQIVKDANSNPETLAASLEELNESRLISRSQIRRIIAEEISKLY